MTEAAFPSPAKLNLFLHITGKRPDGYHNLQTLFQFIDFCDTLYISNTDHEGEIKIQNNIPGVPQEQNLIFKAAQALRDRSGCTKAATIRVEKHLPMGGGLGGGSSNAATTLVALNQLWNTQLPEDTLAEIGLTLGADVPVFVRGKAALAEGIGEHLTPLQIETPWYLLLIPNCHIETAFLFNDKYLTRNSKRLRIRAVLEGQGHNDFEPVARRLFPEIDKSFQLLNQFGHAKLTGTGACLFCSFSSKEAAQTAQNALLAQQPDSLQLTTRVVRGLNTSPLYQNSSNN